MWGNPQRFVLAFLVIGLLIVPAWGPASGATPGPTPESISPANAERQASSPPGGLGLVPSSADKLRLVGMPEGLVSVGELPDSVDLTSSSALLQAQPSGQGIPPVGYQGETNTCTGWATSYYYKTYQEWLDYGWSLRNGAPYYEPNYDHIFSPSFVYNQVAVDKPDYDCGDGAQIPKALELIVDQGDLPWNEFPFDFYDCSVQPTTDQRDAAVLYSGADYGAFFIATGPPTGPEQNHYLTPLKQRLANNDPFVLGFPIYSEFDNYQCNQVVEPPADPGTYRGLHAVAVVGYDNDWAGVGAFKIVNSYGSSWGCYGYAWLSYDFVRQYAWEAWWMEDDRRPWIDPTVPDRYSPTIGGTIMVDLTPYENDREDMPIDLKWYVEGADHCTVSLQGPSDDVLFFYPSPSNYVGYDEITLILRDSKGAEDTQQLTLGWFDLNITYELPLGLGY